MSTEGHQQLVILLQPLCTLGNDYRMLAAEMGKRNKYILYLGSLNEPVKTLIMEYEREGRTIDELISLLEKINRPDVVEELEKYKSEFCCCCCCCCCFSCFVYLVHTSEYIKYLGGSLNKTIDRLPVL